MLARDGQAGATHHVQMASQRFFAFPRLSCGKPSECALDHVTDAVGWAAKCASFFHSLTPSISPCLALLQAMQAEREG